MARPTSVAPLAGRCSDGRLIVDFLEAYGLPFMPPYLNLSKKPEDRLRGTNFAVAGATALDKSFYRKLGNSGWLPAFFISNKLNLFQNLSCITSATDCDAYLNKSLFLVGEIGSNDYNYVGFTGAGNEEQLRKMVPKVIESVSNAVTVTTRKDYDRYGCLNAFNSLAIYHNQLLLASLAKLRKAHPHARIMYADYYKAATMWTLARLVWDGRCSGMQGPIEVYAAWDGLHLTEAGYQHMTVALINGSQCYLSLIIDIHLGL
ncbi:hypothetical protein QQ045_002636 [Rhodiola kirilowii]